MTDMDLTEAIGAAANAAQRTPLSTDRELLVKWVAAAAPVIERQVRERVAAEILAPDHHAGVSVRHVQLHDARIARGDL